MIILYTKLVTMATEVKRKQLCKNDYITVKFRLWESRERKQKVKKCPRSVDGWVETPKTEALALENKLRSGDTWGGACLLRCQCWTGSRHISERDGMEGGGTRRHVPGTKSTSLRRQGPWAHFMRRCSMFLCSNPSCPQKLGEACQNSGPFL